MNQPAYPSTQQSEGSTPVTPAPLVDPNLSATLQNDHDAILNDLREAKQVAATLEVQLAGKSKEVMHLKFLLEQTKTNLGHMQDGIAAMRKERHKLANTAMRTPVMDIMLARVTAERDQLRAELNRVTDRPTGVKPASALFLDERDHQIADLTSELFTLRQELAAVRRMDPPPATVASEPPRVSPSAGETSGVRTSAEASMEIIPAETVPGIRRRA